MSEYDYPRTCIKCPDSGVEICGNPPDKNRCNDFLVLLAEDSDVLTADLDESRGAANARCPVGYRFAGVAYREGQIKSKFVDCVDASIYAYVPFRIWHFFCFWACED
ncbi:MAG: hypothetical protein R3E10_10380 [Gemmatimonadota bacterium]